MDAALLTLKMLLDTENIQLFDRTHVKRCQGKVHDMLDALNLVEYLMKKQPTDGIENYENVLDDYKKANKVCRHTILCTFLNKLYGVYCSY